MTVVQSRPATKTASFSTGWTVALHLLPGVVAAVVYFALVPLAKALSLPTAAALGASGLIAVAPVQLAVLTAYAHRHGERAPWAAIVYRRRLRWPVTLAWAGLLFVLAAAAFLITAPLASGLKAAWFGWWPADWLVDLGTSGGFSNPQLLVTAVILLVGTVIVAPLVEEMYFRGFLLPRMPDRLGQLAPAVHAALFGLYHLWTPWLAPTRFLAIVPLAYVVARTRSIRVAVVAHMIANAVDLVVLLAYLSRR